MQLELTQEQFLELMRLTYIGEVVINGDKTEDFDLAAQELKDLVIQTAVQNNILDYIEYDASSKSHDYSEKKSANFLNLLDQYREEAFHTDLVAIVAQNIIYDTHRDVAIEKMSEKEYDAIFDKTTEAVDREFKKNDYENLTIKK